MRRGSGYILVASSLVLALLSSVVLVEVTSATPRVQSLDQASVNRTLKGDRQAPVSSRAKTETQAVLPDGCESILSVITRSPLAQIARRCVS
jgi:hypothetical protein